LANCLILQIVNPNEFETDNSLLDIDSNSKPKGVQGIGENSDTIASDACCADLDCNGRYSPDVHILLIRTFNANNLFWVYRHTEIGFKVILLLHSIDQFRPLMPDHWLTYKDSVVSRLHTQPWKRSTAAHIGDLDMDVDRRADEDIEWDHIQKDEAIHWDWIQGIGLSL
jgi:hypothetical protein